jgi:RNA polymerase sigma-70 factor (ECF subfamily)
MQVSTNFSKYAKMNQELQELAIRAKGGDIEAFNEIVTRWWRNLFVVIIRNIADDKGKPGKPQDAEEVLNDVFKEAHRDLDKWNPEEVPFIAVLMKKAHDRSVDWLKVNHKLRKVYGSEEKVYIRWVSTSADDYSETETDTDTSAADMLRLFEHEEVKGGILEIADEVLGEQQAEVFRRRMEGESYEDIAASMGLDVGTVRSYYFKARNKLQNQQRVTALLASVAFFGVDMEGIAIPAGMSAPVITATTTAAGAATTTGAAAVTTAASTAATTAAASTAAVGGLAAIGSTKVVAAIVAGALALGGGGFGDRKSVV